MCVTMHSSCSGDTGDLNSGPHACAENTSLSILPAHLYQGFLPHQNVHKRKCTVSAILEKTVFSWRQYTLPQHCLHDNQPLPSAAFIVFPATPSTIPVPTLKFLTSFFRTQDLIRQGSSPLQSQLFRGQKNWAKFGPA